MTMAFLCTFHFKNNLNDFLPARIKHQPVQYTGKCPVSVKDAIEAVGVPHVEVKVIRVNGIIVSFSYLLQSNDIVEAIPYGTVVISSPAQFILDVHLGKLARLLRLLGFDTHYQTDYDDAQIVALGVTQDRVVLTRDVGLLKHKVLVYGYWLRSQHPEEQLIEVIKRFSLCESIRPFSRCIACNSFIAEVQKETIKNLIPPNTNAYFQQFYQCSGCGKIYWKGSHYEKMLRQIERIRLFACQVSPAAL